MHSLHCDTANFQTTDLKGDTTLVGSVGLENKKLEEIKNLPCITHYDFAKNAKNLQVAIIRSSMARSRSGDVVNSSGHKY
jgi:hypothetical protein